MKQKDGSQSDRTLLIHYLDHPHHPSLDDLTYLEFGAKCYLITHDLSKPLHESDVLEENHISRPTMCIQFFKPQHIGVSRIQMVYPQHGEVFYLRALLIHRTAHGWQELKTIGDIYYPTYQLAAEAFGLFNNQNEATMAFNELLELQAPPTQL
jgi:hypothetical protein